MSTGTYTVRNVSERVRQRIRALSIAYGISSGELITKLVNEEFEDEAKTQERTRGYMERTAKLDRVRNDPDYFFCTHCKQHYMLCGCVHFKSVSQDVTFKVKMWREARNKKLGLNTAFDV